MSGKNLKYTAILLITALSLSFISPLPMCNPVKGGLNASEYDTLENENISLQGNISLPRGDQLISVSLRDSDVKQVIRMFADKCGVNVVFHDSVSGNITLDLVNVSLNNALKMIMQMKELTYVMEHNSLLVMSSEAGKKLSVSKQNLNVIPIKYVNATKIADFLNKNIFGSKTTGAPGVSNNEIAVVNPSLNHVMIFGTEDDYEMAKKIVKILDKKPKITLFKVNHTTPREMSRLVCETLFLKISKNQGEDKSFFAFQQVTDAASNQEKQKTQQVVQSQTNMGTIGSQTTQSISLPDIVMGGQTLACQLSGELKDSKDLTSFDVGGLSITFAPQAGTLTMIGGSDEQVEMVSEFIKMNDKKQPQAFIELSVIELTESGSKEFNNSWGINTRWFSGSVGGGGLQTSPGTPIFWAGSSVDGFTKWGTSPVITQTLSYLIENRKGRVLASPRILTTNGQTSVIDLSSDYVKKVTSEVLATSSTLAGATQRTYDVAEDNGIKIALIPFISRDGYVSLNLKPMYATIKEQIYQTGVTGQQDLAATLLQRRNLDLKGIRIKDGETLILGGLIQETENHDVSKPPILGDIPILGMFFRNSTKNSEKSELVITVTPHIVHDAEDVSNMENL